MKIKKLTVLLVSLLLLVSCSSLDNRAKFIRGTVDNNVYESRLASLRFSPGPSWEFASDDNVYAMNGIDRASASNEEEAAELLNERTTVYDMTAEDPATGTSVAVVFENMSLYVGGDETTVEEYLDKLKAGIEEMYSSYGVTVERGAAASLGDETFECLTARLTVDSKEVVQRYYIRKTGSFFMSVSITAGDAVNVEEEILPMFESVK